MASRALCRSVVTQDVGRRSPRFATSSIATCHGSRPGPGASLQTLDLDEQKALVAALDASYLFIQGPPGSGKTCTGARLIVSLIAVGQARRRRGQQSQGDQQPARRSRERSPQPKA